MKLKSAYHRRFWLRLWEAVRTGWATLFVAALLLYVPRIKMIASVPVLAPALTIIVAGPALGTVLQNGVGILTVAIPALASTMVVLQVLKPPISKFAAIACTGVSSYVIAYLSEAHLLGRKAALAQVSIVYITAHFRADMNVVYFPLKMIAPDVIGVVAAIVAAVLPIPRLAVWEVRDSAKSAARGSSEFFKTMVKAISASEASTFGSMHLHSKVLATASADSLIDLKNKQVDIWWELRAFGAIHNAIKQFTKGFDSLNLYLTGMEMALESGNILCTPRPLRYALQGTLMKVVDQCKLLLDASVKGLLSRRSSSSIVRRMSRQKLIQEGMETLKLFDINYRSAREQAYYTPGTDTACSSDAEITEDVVRLWKQDRTTLSNLDGPLVRRKFRGRVSMLFFLFNLRLYLVEAINLVSRSAGDNTSNDHEMHRIAEIGGVGAVLEAAGTNKTRPEAGPDENSIDNCAKSNFAPVLLSPDDPSVDDSRRYADLGGLNHDSSSRRSREWNPLQCNEDSRPQASTLGPDRDRDAKDSMEANEKGKLPSRGVKHSSMDGHCSHRKAVATENIIKTAGGMRGESDTKWKFLKRLGIKPSKTQSKRSFKTALSMILATIFGFLAVQGPQAFWAPLTVGFLIGNLQGGSWRMSFLRLQGTVLGSIYGFLALRASQNYRWAILVLLVPWVIFSSFIRSSPVYGYAGLVSAFTAAILMLGGYDDNVKQFAMDRITDTFIGIFCFVFVETAVFPERARVLVRQELVSSLISLRDCVGAIVTVYTEKQACIHCRSLAVNEIKKLEKGLRASFAKQSALSKEAALEPDLWFVPFPADVYSKLIGIQGRMLDLSFFMVCSLQWHATTEYCLSTSEQMETLLKPLRTSLTALQEEVLATIGSLQEALQSKAGQEGKLARLKRSLRELTGLSASGGHDVEQPQIPRPHARHPLLLLGHQHRSADGIPSNLKSVLDWFEHNFENVLCDLIATTIAEEDKPIVSNSVMMSVGSLTFSLHSLLRETVNLEKAVHELLQAENPWSVLDFWDTYSVGMVNGSGVAGLQFRNSGSQTGRGVQLSSYTRDGIHQSRNLREEVADQPPETVH